MLHAHTTGHVYANAATADSNGYPDDGPYNTDDRRHPFGYRDKDTHPHANRYNLR